MQKQRRSYARALRHISPAASGQLAPQVEDDLYVAVCARRTRGGDGFSVLSQPKTRPDEIVELYLGRDPHRQLEALHLLAPVLVDSVGICTSEPNLFVPERGEIQAAPRPRHPDQRYRPRPPPALGGSVGICTSAPNLFAPERGGIQAAPRPRHPDKRYRPPGGAKP